MHKLQYHWKEGRHYDLWSVTHTLSGVVLGAILFYFEMGLLPAFIIATVLFVGWEVVEVVLGIKEHVTNMVMDVIFDFAGFLIVLYFYLGLDKSVSIEAVIYSTLACVIFGIWGFLSHRYRAKKGESHLQ